MLNVSLLLWRGELRAQRLVSRRVGVTIAMLMGMLGILAFLATGVRSLLVTGALPTTNIAMLSVAGTMIIFLNVGVIGQESSASVSDIRGWARPLPVSAAQVRRLLVTTGLFRSALFTLTLMGAAVGALSASASWTARTEIVCAAILLPALPVAAGLWSGARRPPSASPRFVTTPLAIVMIAIAIPFPSLPGPLGGVLRALATPGLVLLGSAAPTEAATMGGLWILGALWFMVQLDREAGTANILDLPPRAARLARAQGPGVVVDLVLHRIRVRDAGEIVLLVVLLATTALASVAFGATGSAAAGSFIVVVLAASVAIMGYDQMRTATALPASAEAWVRSLPLPSGALAWVRHVVATLGAWWAVIIFGAVLAAGALAGLDISPFAFVALLVTPWSLGGWIGLGSRSGGVRRLLLLAGLAQFAAVRAGVVAVAVLVGCSVPVALLLITIDLGLGLAGHLTFRHNMRS